MRTTWARPPAAASTLAETTRLPPPRAVRHLEAAVKEWAARTVSIEQDLFYSSYTRLC
jgi:hypothetical protein